MVKDNARDGNTEQAGRTGKPVEFPVTCAYKFVPGKAEIKSLVVSWAAFELMEQLGIIPADVIKMPTTPSTLTIKQLNDRCIAFSKAFEEDIPEARKRIALQYLDEEVTCTDTHIGSIKGTKEFLSYLERFRIIFPKLEFSNVRFHSKDKDPARMPARVHMGLFVQAYYRGRLTRGETKNASFPANILFVFNPKNDKIFEIIMTWQVAEFLKQIEAVRT